MDHETERDGAEIFGRQKSIHKTTIRGPRKAMSGSLLPKNFVSPNKLVGNGERDYKSRFRIQRNHSGPLPNLQKNSMTYSLSVEDVPEGSVVQRKGRFKITADSGPSPKFLIQVQVACLVLQLQVYQLPRFFRRCKAFCSIIPHKGKKYFD